MYREVKKSKWIIRGRIKPGFIAKVIAEHGKDTELGAHLIFLGQVRKDRNKKRAVAAINYSAYIPMAQKMLEEISHEMIKKYRLLCFHAFHSTGSVKAGEVSLFVLISSIHRERLSDAMKETINLIKAKVPVWKQEVYSDGTFAWVK